MLKPLVSIYKCLSAKGTRYGYGLSPLKLDASSSSFPNSTHNPPPTLINICFVVLDKPVSHATSCHACKRHQALQNCYQSYALVRGLLRFDPDQGIPEDVGLERRVYQLHDLPQVCQTRHFGSTLIDSLVAWPCFLVSVSVLWHGQSLMSNRNGQRHT